MPQSPGTPGEPRLNDWNLLRSFIAVCETRTLTAAAESLGLSQPTLSRHIRELEALVGETLFDRLPGQMKPTERAELLMERLHLLRDGVGRFEHALWGGDETASGTVRVTTSQTFGALLLPRLLAPLLRSAPLLQVEVQATDEVQNLLRREADIAVRFFRPEQDDVIAVPVGRTEVGLFAHQDLVRSLPPDCTPHDIKGRYIGDIDIERTLQIAAASGHPLRRTDFCFRSSSSVTQFTAVEAGIGVAGLMAVCAAERPALCRLFPEVVALPVEVWVCAHDDLRRSPRIRRVFDHLVDALRQLLAGAAPKPSG